MAQPPSHTVTTTRTITPAATPPPPAPVMFGTSSPGTQLARQRLADLVASVRDIPALNPLAGITSGPGNQGSACQAQLLGHSGTPATFLGCPRVLGAAGSWGMGP